MASSLLKLRAYVIAGGGESFEIDADDAVMIDGDRFLCIEKSGYKSSRAGEDEYSLGPILLLVQEMIFGEKKHSAYIGACVARGWRPVLPNDRQELLDYLQGRIDHSSKLQKSVERRSVEGRRTTEAVFSPEHSQEKEVVAVGEKESEIDLFKRKTIEDQEKVADEDLDPDESWAKPVYSGKNGFLFAQGADFSYGFELWKKARKEIIQKEEGNATKTKKRTEFGKQSETTEIQNLGQRSINHEGASSPVSKEGLSAPSDPSKRQANGTTRKAPTSEESNGREKKRRLSEKVSSSAPKRSSNEPYIIVVPSTATSVLTLLNAVDLLRDGKYISNNEKRAAGAKRESSIVIERKRSTDETLEKFRIIDNPTRLTPKEFDRIVAVFAIGPNWQFKGWKYSQPVDLFQRVLGIHLQFDDEITHVNISQWNVRILKLSKTKRHLDSSLVLDFWRFVEEHIQKIKAQNAAKIKSSLQTQAHRASHRPSSHRHHDQLYGDKRKKQNPPSSADKSNASKRQSAAIDTERKTR